MRTVYENLQSYFGISSEDKKPNDRKRYGISLFKRLFDGHGKTTDQALPDAVVRRKLLSRKGSPGRVHSIHSDSRLSPLENSATDFPSSCSAMPSSEVSHGGDQGLSIEHGWGKGFVSHGAMEKMKSPPGKSTPRMGLRDWDIKEHQDPMGRCRLDVAAVHSVRNSLADPFDKCTTEYYSCGKKRMHSGKLASQIARCGHATCATEGDQDEEALRKCSAGSNSLQLSEPSDVEEPSITAVEGLLHGVHDTVSLAESSCAAVANQPCEVAPPVACSTPKPLFKYRDSEGSNDALSSCCEVGCSEEGESNWEGATFAPAFARHDGRKFPPPLSFLTMQGYCDKRSQTSGTRTAGYCLRSLRKDGRFVLQEVKAPCAHHFLRVSRKEGRLKLELVHALNESSAEYDDDEEMGKLLEIASKSEVAETSEVGTQSAFDSSTNEGLCDTDQMAVATVIGSPSCSEMRTLCTNQRPSLKSRSNWVHPTGWVPAF